MSNEHDKKPRTRIINLQVPPGSEIQIPSAIENDKIVIKIRRPKDSRPTDIHVTTSFERKKGPKITNFVKFSASDFDITLNQGVRKRYSKVFGIDTNYQNINGQKRCVSCWTVLDEDSDNVKPLLALSFQVPDSAENPEKYAWKAVIDLIQSSEGYSDEFRVGIVVDSELGSLQSINDRTKEILEGFVLPLNFELMYASADKRNDSLLNQIIYQTDKHAKEVFDQLKNHSEEYFPAFGEFIVFPMDDCVKIY